MSLDDYVEKEEKELRLFAEKEGKTLATIEMMKFHLVRRANIYENMTYRSCIHAFTTHLGFLLIHSTDGDMRDFYDIKVQMDKFLVQLHNFIVEMEFSGKENSKNNKKESIN